VSKLDAVLSTLNNLSAVDDVHEYKKQMPEINKKITSGVHWQLPQIRFWISKVGICVICDNTTNGL